MRALAVVEPGRVECLDVAEASGDGSIVAIEAANVGIGDIRAIRGQRRSVSHGRSMTFPHIPGFAAVGHVLRPDAAARSRGISKGDRVVIAGVWGCGQCDWCRRSLSNLCDNAQLIGIDSPDTGLWRERVCIDGRRLQRISNNVDYRVAAIVTEIATVARALDRASILAGQSVAVMGLGNHGLLAVPLAIRWGAATVIGIDPASEARDAARRLGASVVHSPEEYLQFVLDNPSLAPDRVLHLTSAKGTIGLAAKMIAHRGIIVAVGTPDDEPVVIPEYYQQMIVKETTIVGTYSKSDEYWSKAVAIAESGAISVPEPNGAVKFGCDAADYIGRLAKEWPIRGRHYITLVQ